MSRWLVIAAVVLIASQAIALGPPQLTSVADMMQLQGTGRAASLKACRPWGGETVRQLAWVNSEGCSLSF